MGRKLFLGCLATVALISAGGLAQAVTMTFDGITTAKINGEPAYVQNGMSIPLIGGSTFPSSTNDTLHIGDGGPDLSGYAFSLVSGGTFTIDSLDFLGSSSWYNCPSGCSAPLPVMTIAGRLNGAAVASKTFNHDEVDPGPGVSPPPRLITIGGAFSGIDQFIISVATTGFPPGGSCITFSPCNHFTIDNLRFTPASTGGGGGGTPSPVPIPAPFMLLAGTLAAVATAAKARRKSKSN